MPVRLLIADIDGTLVTRDKVITDRTRQAVRRLRDERILFSVTTGRPPRGVAGVSRTLELTTPIAAFNGGVLVRPDLEIIEQRTIPLAVAREVVQFLEAAGIDVWVYTAVDWFVERLDAPRLERERSNVGFDPVVVEDLQTVLEKAVKIAGVCMDAPLLARCEAELRSRVGAEASAVRFTAYYLDVTHADANKGMVVRLESRFLRIPMDEIAVIGDMLNDVTMFGVAGTSIAMGNAPPEVRRAARHVTTSNDEEGFANAVDWFILGHPHATPASLGLPSRTRACLFGLDGSSRFAEEVRRAGIRTAQVSSATTPAALIAAARAVGAEPRDTVVFEETPAGVEAARVGHFLYVVGVGGAQLRAHGADAVVPDLTAMLEAP